MCGLISPTPWLSTLNASLGKRMNRDEYSFGEGEVDDMRLRAFGPLRTPRLFSLILMTERLKRLARDPLPEGILVTISEVVHPEPVFVARDGPLGEMA
jgi:hypothetical protein